MKRIICIMLGTALLSASLAACNGGGDQAPAATPPPASATATPAPANPAVTSEVTSSGPDFSGAPRVNLVFSTYMPDTDPTTLDMLHYLDIVNEYTEGTVEYTLHAAQSLVAGNEGLDAVRAGLCDLAFFATGYGSGSLPLCYMLEYPGVLYESHKALAYTIKEWFEVVRPPEISDVKLLFALGQGGGVFATTIPLRVYEDFAGKQIRTTASLIPVIEAYGAFPTFMVIGEVYEALRTGVIQGHHGIANAVYTFNIHEVTDYILMDPFYLFSGELFLNMDVWNSLTEDQQAAIEAAGEDAFDAFLSAGREKEVSAAIEEFRKAGLEINSFSDEDYAKMAAANGPLQEAYAAGVEGGPEALALLRETAAKYNALYPG